MICPHCGNEIEDELLQCSHCGNAVHAGVNWGVRNSSADYDRYRATSGPSAAYIAASPRSRRKRSHVPKAVAALLALGLVGGMGFLGFSLAQGKAAPSSSAAVAEEDPSAAAQKKWHDVTIAVQASGFDEKSTPLPVEVSGADAAGNSYSQVAYVKSDGTGLRLPTGKFGVRPAASPISSEGNLFLFNTNNKWFSVDTELEAGVPLDVSDEIQIVLEPADPSDLSLEGVESARSYAVGSGMDEATVDQLLESVRNAIAQRQSSIPFNGAQTYRNTTFVGDVRTNTGFATAAGIEGAQACPVRTDLFLFTNNSLYYADDAPSNEQESIALHMRNMSTGMETILATDLCSQTRPFYCNGTVVYEALEYGSHSIKQVNTNPEDAASLSDRLPWGMTKLVGVKDSSVLVASENGQMPQLATLPLGEGEATVVQLGESYGDVLGLFGDRALVYSSGWDANHLSAYDLSGKKLWEKDAPSGFAINQTTVADDEYLYVLNKDANQLLRMAIKTGEGKTYDLDVAYLYDIMLVRDGHLYFAGSDTYNDDSENVTYSVYDLNLDTGQANSIGSYQTPQDEDLAVQDDSQDSGTWGGWWDNTWTDTSGSWGSTGTYGYGYGTGTWDSTGTYGYGTGTDATGTYGYGTGTDATGTYGYGTGTDATGTWTGGTDWSTGTWGTGTGY